LTTLSISVENSPVRVVASTIRNAVTAGGTNAGSLSISTVPFTAAVPVTTSLSKLDALAMSTFSVPVGLCV
jgi:hypothetical protein